MPHNRMVWLGVALASGLTGCSLIGQAGVNLGSRPSLNLYATLPANNSISVLSITDRRPLGSIAVGQGPANLVVNPRSDREYVYCTNENDGTVSFVNLRSGQNDQSIQSGSNPWGIGVSPLVGNQQWLTVANYGDGTYSRIDTNSRASVQHQANFTSPGRPHGVVASPKTLEAYVFSDVPALTGSGTDTACEVIRVDATGSPVDRKFIPGSRSLWRGAIDKDGKFLYLTDRGTNKLHRVDLSSFTPVTAWDLGDGNGDDVVIDPTARTAYVSVPVGNSTGNMQGVVEILDLSSGTLVSHPLVNNPIKEANRPQALAINSAGTELWVALQNRLGFFSDLKPAAQPGVALSVVQYTLTPGQAPPIGDLATGPGVQ